MEQRVHLIDESYTVTDILSSLQDMKMLKRRDLFFPAYNRSSITDILHDISGFCTYYEVITAKKTRKIIRASKKA